MQKPIIILAVVVVVIAGVWSYFLLSGTEKQKTPEVKLPGDQTVRPPKDETTITIKEFSFTPQTLNIKVGQTVTWVNEDGVVHTVDGQSFKSPNIKNGESFKFQFTQAGTFDYTCNIHPAMKGKVVVE